MRPWSWSSHTTTVTHYPTQNSEGIIYLQLNLKNSCLGRFKNRQKCITLWDSSASLILIWEATILNKSYLRSLPQQTISGKRFKVGNGNIIVANKLIEFDLIVQGEVFKILGGLGVVIGTKVHSTFFVEHPRRSRDAGFLVTQCKQSRTSRGWTSHS